MLRQKSLRTGDVGAGGIPEADVLEGDVSPDDGEGPAGGAAGVDLGPAVEYGEEGGRRVPALVSVRAQRAGL